MEQPIRIGAIGLGGIFEAVHLPGIQASGDLRLAALCDIDPVVLHTRGEALGIERGRCYTDYRELIHSPAVDAVSISTPNDSHFAIAMEAVRAGKPFALEKPVTLTAGEADLLAGEAERQGIAHMVCFSYRFKAAARYARELVGKGELGEICQISMEYLQSWALPRANTPYVWRFEKARSGSGALADLGCHALDLVRFVTGCGYGPFQAQAGTKVRHRPDSGGVSRMVDVDDYCNFMTTTGDGAPCTFQISRLALGRDNYQRLEIYGSEGSLIYLLDGGDSLYLCKPERGEFQYHPVEIPPAFQAEQMQEFANRILGKSDGLPADLEDGRITQHWMEEIMSAAGI